MEHLRHLRENKGLSQAALSELTGISRDSISNYETGKRKPWPSTQRRLATALGTSIPELNGEKPKLVYDPMAWPPQVP